MDQVPKAVKKKIAAWQCRFCSHKNTDNLNCLRCATSLDQQHLEVPPLENSEGKVITLPPDSPYANLQRDPNEPDPDSGDVGDDGDFGFDPQMFGLADAEKLQESLKKAQEQLAKQQAQIRTTVKVTSQQKKPTEQVKPLFPINEKIGSRPMSPGAPKIGQPLTRFTGVPAKNPYAGLERTESMAIPIGMTRDQYMTGQILNTLQQEDAQKKHRQSVGGIYHPPRKSIKDRPEKKKKADGIIKFSVQYKNNTLGFKLNSSTPISTIEDTVAKRFGLQCKILLIDKEKDAIDRVKNNDTYFLEALGVEDRISDDEDDLVKNKKQSNQNLTELNKIQTQQDKSKPKLLPGWSVAFTKDGKLYYENRKTRQSQWKPPLANPSTQSQVSVSPGTGVALPMSQLPGSSLPGASSPGVASYNSPPSNPILSSFNTNMGGGMSNWNPNPNINPVSSSITPTNIYQKMSEDEQLKQLEKELGLDDQYSQRMLNINNQIDSFSSPTNITGNMSSIQQQQPYKPAFSSLSSMNTNSPRFGINAMGMNAPPNTNIGDLGLGAMSGIPGFDTENNNKFQNSHIQQDQNQKHWDCPSCTFQNSNNVIECMLCGTKQPTKSNLKSSPQIQNKEAKANAPQSPEEQFAASLNDEKKEKPKKQGQGKASIMTDEGGYGVPTWGTPKEKKGYEHSTLTVYHQAPISHQDEKSVSVASPLAIAVCPQGEVVTAQNDDEMRENRIPRFSCSVIEIRKSKYQKPLCRSNQRPLPGKSCMKFASITYMETERQRITAERIARNQEFVDNLKNGSMLTKFSHNGSQINRRFIKVSKDGTEIGWGDSEKSRIKRKEVLAEVKHIVFGPFSQAFGDFDWKRGKPWLCFSLHLEHRTLDLMCSNEKQVIEWFLGLQSLIPMSCQHLSLGAIFWRRSAMKLAQQARRARISRKEMSRDLLIQARKDASRSRWTNTDLLDQTSEKQLEKRKKKIQHYIR